MEIVITAIIALILGGAVVFIIKKIQDENSKKSARVEAERIVNKAKSEAAKIKKDSETKAKDFESRARKNVEADIHKQKSTVKNKEAQLERRLKEIDDQFKQKMEENDRYLNTLKDREEKIAISENRIKDLEKKGEAHIDQLKNKLESVAAMTQEEARRQLLSALEDEAKQEAAKKIAQIEDEANKESEKKAKRILATALSRFASEYTSERTVSVLALPSDEMKGKIIGREGRNIRTLEAHCGVDLIVDDTPEAVVISGFDPVRRELARRTIEKLMEDGRVHPARIEEVVEKQRNELMKSIKEEGERHVIELGIPNMHPELVKIIGGLKYRSYQGQNALNQALEVANIAGLLAGELGVNVKIARRAGLLHNIGKAIDHTVEGSYATVGAEMAKKYNESEDVCHAIRAHDEEEKPHSILAWIVHAAYILSSSRPGARRPQMDSFVHRLEDLESIGNSFDGVLKTLALQAGKDVRVLVESSKVTDDQAVMLSRDIARKIEREMPQVGAIKITVVRETRSVEHAR
ncbi:ribonuclease Y [Bdellovibrio bacteriovorus]|uniref:Ribonuclease Y n=1 Tax=Bdellovibrio bacteriovorus TaxID=959 RepID=A0A150WFQ2_BDEBC|nr:ribonuclease Y [Bdellovibrio bacteriovorus]KYG61631.1 ribonuclease Y [Bdellovibrio bacteriovorus]